MPDLMSLGVWRSRSCRRRLLTRRRELIVLLRCIDRRVWMCTNSIYEVLILRIEIDSIVTWELFLSGIDNCWGSLVDNEGLFVVLFEFHQCKPCLYVYQRRSSWFQWRIYPSQYELGGRMLDPQQEREWSSILWKSLPWWWLYEF